jgi:hypothetical protein
MRKSMWGVLFSTMLVVGVLAGRTAAAPVLYDPFDYPVGEPPSGLSVADGETATGWLYINNANTDEPKMAPGSLGYPGLPAPSGNSVAIDGDGVNAASQSQRAIPGQPYNEGTKLYYSVIMKVNSLAGMSLTGANYAGGSFIAGFRDSDATTTFGASNAGAPVLIRAANTAGTAYQLGTAVTATAVDRMWYGDNADSADDPATDFDASDTLLVVLSYDAVVGDADVVRMYINPDPALSEEANAAALKLAVNTGTEIAGNDIQSFFFRNNSVAPDVVQFDELRIGTAWEDVVPLVPEPAFLAPLAIAALALTARRRR